MIWRMIGQHIRPLYIFTVLAFLLMLTLWVTTHNDLSAEIHAILNTVSGGLLAMLGTVVNHEFNSAKDKELNTRATDTPTGLTAGAPAKT